jgi:hypothetical protein
LSSLRVFRNLLGPGPAAAHEVNDQDRLHAHLCTLDPLIGEQAIFVFAVNHESLISPFASFAARFALCSILSVVDSDITYVGTTATNIDANTTAPNILERRIVLALPSCEG